MKALAVLGAAGAALLAAATCRTTRTTVARLITPTPGPVSAAPPAAPTAVFTPMPVVTAPASTYDRQPGVFYEQRLTPTPHPARTATPPAAAAASPARATPTPAPARGATATATAVSPEGRATPTPRPSRTPIPGRPTPTHKPGVYYEDQDSRFKPAVTWTPTPFQRP